jgi:hypothetical protein
MSPNDPITADEWVEEMLASAPALTSEQRTQLAELLEPVRRRPTSSATTKRGGHVRRAERVRRSA